MSLVSAVGRVAELQALLVPAPVPAPSAAGGFQDQLIQATAGAQTATAPTAASAAPGGPTPYDAEIQAAATKHGLDPALLKGLIKQESGFNPNAGSPAGAQGLTQLMPGTARGLGVTDPYDPVQSIDGGARYLRQQLDAFGGDVTLALAAYNAGPGAVKRFGGVPPYAETQSYVQRVQELAAGYRGAPAVSGALTASATTVPPSGASALAYSTV